jgi:hypothetical protein
MTRQSNKQHLCKVTKTKQNNIIIHTVDTLSSIDNIYMDLEHQGFDNIPTNFNKLRIKGASVAVFTGMYTLIWFNNHPIFGITAERHNFIKSPTTIEPISLNKAALDMKTTGFRKQNSAKR